jgi:transposase InsO family protein
VSHRKARLTVEGRLLIVNRYEQGWKQAHIAAAMGVSRKCVRKWLDRYATEGLPGLDERSSRPHHCPAQTSEEAEERVVELRRREHRGRDWIAAESGVPARTVSRILARRGLPPLAACDPITGTVIRASWKGAVRYERARPGDLAHMDVKKLAKIPEGGGWRAHGTAATSRQRHKDEPIGYDYVHSLVDDHSRLAYCEVLADETGPTCADFLARGAAYFAEHGILHISHLMTDNAWAYHFSLRGVCEELWIKQIFIKPHCPWQNGKVERLNRTLLTEWAYRQVFTTNDQRTAALAIWLEDYNTQRRHSAIGALPPISRL